MGSLGGATKKRKDESEQTWEFMMNNLNHPNVREALDYMEQDPWIPDDCPAWVGQDPPALAAQVQEFLDLVAWLEQRP